jgi:hypothetical protein
MSLEERAERHQALRKTIAETLANHKSGDDVQPNS